MTHDSKITQAIQDPETRPNRNIEAWLQAPGMIELRRSVMPPVLPDQYVRLRVAYCALCGSDLAFYRGRPGADYPRTLGHEYCGTVIMTGSLVTAFRPADRVVVDPNYRCGYCFYCKSGASNLCDSSEANLFDQRGFSAFVDIHQTYLHPLPVMNPPYLGALVEPLSCTVHALSLANVQRDDSILILGCGGQGSLLAFALSVIFPGSQFSVYDPHQARLSNLTQVFGQSVKSLNKAPRRPDFSLIFEASGQTAGFKLATLSLRQAGRIIVISRYRDRRTVYLPPDFPRRQPTVIFSHLNGDGKPFIQALEMLSKNWQPRHHALVQVQPLSQLPVVLEQMDQLPCSKMIFDLQHAALIQPQVE
jgi:(R,R)-butanediol dehydrogenase/meso-butanediol dehydrogenase/diacetyl reductase